jgi:hypothetical protein
MATLRWRNAAVLFKEESVEDTPETPSASTDAVKVENLAVNFNPQQIQTNEATGSLDSSGPIPVGLQTTISFDVLLKGSGAAGTPPECNEMLKACGWAETITASAIPASPEAATAGSATSVTLGASFTATAQLYRGMPLSLTVNPTAATPFISDYTVGKLATLTDTFSPVLDGTTLCQIPANVLYTPASDSIPSGTLEIYVDGIKYIFAGSRGAPVFNVATQNVGRISFNFNGRFVSQTDLPVPATTYDSTRPPAFKNAVMNLDRVCVALQNFSVDTGNSLVNLPDPCAAQGWGPAQITERNMTGSMDPNKTLVATRDVITAMDAGTSVIIHARWGEVTGNKVAITVPSALYTGVSLGDRSGIVTEELTFFPSGEDSGAFICFY